jgi:8-oxo-dGTP pyrophosphatase MutT (NUDIX family)
MTDNHAQLQVSCKCALYTPDRQHVLLADYGSQGYGLPGGHVNVGESPDHAMARELEEELGLSGGSLTRADFWLHESGKLILGYTGWLDQSTQLFPQPSELHGAVWAPIADIANGTIKVPSYKEFILKFKDIKVPTKLEGPE